MTPEESALIIGDGIAIFQNTSLLIFQFGIWAAAYNLVLVKFAFVVSLSGGQVAQDIAANLKCGDIADAIVGTEATINLNINNTGIVDWVEAILLLLIESGAIFGVVQVAEIILNVLDIHAAALSSFENAIHFLNALNPVALVILIQTGSTYEQSFHLEDVPTLDINSVSNVN
ncbi:hypothetical protein BT96DRAFT_933497 [Gymnopus androsaceus JB14]|uniref:Uncharacterized protein n=1 Tax=Gymnopus androsaceus JB14 TaxID=1447944 RepID=A0A6A4ICW5_9AGAR|nr:hypothetical protein BT96DRAFT_933497 [Gymnopus androsaceus JB14]